MAFRSLMSIRRAETANRRQQPLQATSTEFPVSPRVPDDLSVRFHLRLRAAGHCRQTVRRPGIAKRQLPMSGSCRKPFDPSANRPGCAEPEPESSLEQQTDRRPPGALLSVVGHLPNCADARARQFGATDRFGRAEYPGTRLRPAFGRHLHRRFKEVSMNTIRRTRFPDRRMLLP
jgi:hypothetical protein